VFGQKITVGYLILSPTTPNQRRRGFTNITTAATAAAHIGPAAARANGEERFGVSKANGSKQTVTPVLAARW
jgi:hypothetical protein